MRFCHRYLGGALLVPTEDREQVRARQRCSVLQPKYRLGGIKKAAPGFLDEAEQQFETLLRKYWASSAPLPPPPQPNSSPFSDSTKEEWQTSFIEPSPSPEPEDHQLLTSGAEFEKYLEMKIALRDRDEKVKPIALNPLHRWRDHEGEIPVLSKMAVDVLSVPAMSLECEKVFSQGKLTITSQTRDEGGDP